MALNIEIIIHGIPQGQKSLGYPNGTSSKCYQTFYGRSYPANEQMYVEVSNIDGTTNAYYTFVKAKNLFAYEGRPVDYFAITVKMNAYYADVQNMFSILRAAYHKNCVGLILGCQNNKTKFLVSDFEEKKNEIYGLCNNIVEYIQNFSTNTDIVGLNGFACGGSVVANQINFAECSNEVAMAEVGKNGKIVVSQEFPFAGIRDAIAKKEAEIQTIRQQTQREIDEAQRKASRLQSEKDQVSQNIVGLQSEIDKLDKYINRLKSDIVNKDEEIKRLKQKGNTVRTPNVPGGIKEPQPIGGNPNSNPQRKGGNKKPSISIPFLILLLNLVTIVLVILIWCQMPSKDDISATEPIEQQTEEQATPEETIPSQNEVGSDEEPLQTDVEESANPEPSKAGVSTDKLPAPQQTPKEASDKAADVTKSSPDGTASGFMPLSPKDPNATNTKKQ